jgi:hypothetical protein
MAAFWLPVGSTASASSASPPRPIGKRSDGTGSVMAPTAVATEAATDVAFDAAAAISSVGMMRVMNARTAKSAGCAPATIAKRSLSPVHSDRSTALAINLSCASESFASAAATDNDVGNEVGMTRIVLAARISSLLTLTCACVRSPSLGARCW